MLNFRALFLVYEYKKQPGKLDVLGPSVASLRCLRFIIKFLSHADRGCFLAFANGSMSYFPL